MNRCELAESSIVAEFVPQLLIWDVPGHYHIDTGDPQLK